MHHEQTVQCQDCTRTLTVSTRHASFVICHPHRSTFILPSCPCQFKHPPYQRYITEIRMDPQAVSTSVLNQLEQYLRRLEVENCIEVSHHIIRGCYPVSALHAIRQRNSTDSLFIYGVFIALVCRCGLVSPPPPSFALASPAASPSACEDCLDGSEKDLENARWRLGKGGSSGL